MDDDFDEAYYSVPDSRPGYPQQDPLYDSEPTYGGPESDEDDLYGKLMPIQSSLSYQLAWADEEPRSAPPPRAQRHTAPTRPPRGQRPGTQDGSLDEELRSFSPEMQRYVQMLQQRNRAPVPPAKPEKDLQDRLADMHLDDAELSSPPAGRNNPRPRPQHAPRRDMNAPRGTRVPPRFAESYRHNPTVEEYESDEDSARGSVVRNIDSQNVNSSTVVDSHNDNSTKTEISKSRSGKKKKILFSYHSLIYSIS